MFRNDDFYENFIDFRRGFFVHSAVDGEDSAEHGNGVGFIRFYISVVNRLSDAYSAGICVLAGNHARLVEFFHELQSAVRVVDVIIGKLLAPKLFCLGQRSRTNKFFVIIGSALMRVFAVAHILRLFIGERNAVGETNPQLSGEIIGNHAVVYRRMRKHFILKVFFRFQRNAARL